MGFLIPKTWLDAAELFGSVFGVMGAVVISSNIGLVGQGYLVFLISSVLYMFFAWKIGRWPLFAMNAVFCIINLWGIWRWLVEPMI